MPAGVGAAGALDDAKYVAGPGVQRLLVHGRALLHLEGRQQLYELNHTADLIWSALTSDGGQRLAEARLTESGLHPAQARTYVRDALDGWIAAGHLAPAWALRRLRARPDDQRVVFLEGLVVDLAFHGLRAEILDPMLGALYGEATCPARRLSVIRERGVNLLFLDDDLLCGVSDKRLGAQLKAILTDLYVRSVSEGFLAHGALMVRDGASIFLSGAPGAGKSTLALALAAGGWSYGADDIVRVLPDGRACAVPFAAAVKSGAWPLVASAWPAINGAATWLRGDGQSVRYLAPPRLAGREARALDAVVLLSRSPGAWARLEPLGPLDALTAIMESAYSCHWRLTGEALARLVARLETARCVRLVYDGLPDAVNALDRLFDGPP